MALENASLESNSSGNVDNEIQWPNLLLGVFLYCVVLITIIGNTLVLVAIAKFKKLQTVFNFYLVNLAVTDIAVAITAMSFYTTEHILGFWPFGEFLCGVWIFFDYGMTFASVFTLIVISLDRFWSVTWSIHYRAHHNKQKCVKLIIGVWVVMVLLWLPPCIIDRMRNSNSVSCIWEPSTNKGFVVVVAIFGNHVPFLIMLFCYLRVLQVVMKKKKVNSSNHSNDYSSSSNASSSFINTNIEALHRQISSHRNIPEINLKKQGTTISDVPDMSANTGTKSSLNVPNKYGVHLEPINVSTSSRQLHVLNQCSSENRSNNRDRRIFKTLTGIFVGYTICWLPFHIAFDIRAFSPDSISTQAYTMTFWMSYLNSTINPFLYNFSSLEFRLAFKELLCKKRNGRTDLGLPSPT